ALGEDARSRDVPALPARRELAGAFLQDQHRLLVRLVEAGGLSTVEHETPAGQLTRMRRSPALNHRESALSRHAIQGVAEHDGPTCMIGSVRRLQADLRAG